MAIGKKPLFLWPKNLQMENLELWKKLYTLAATYYKLAPWEWMYEQDNFAIRVPNNNKLYFVSIMGAGGEHNAITAYEGVAGFSKFIDLANNPEAYPPETILTIPQVMLSFESNMSQVSKDQKAIMKALGLTYKGKFKIPHLTQTIPGYVPYTPETAVIEDFIVVLEQAIEVAKLTEKDSEVLFSDSDDADPYLVRKVKPNGNGNEWYDEFETFDFNIEPLPILWPEIKLMQLAKIPTKGHVLEIDIKLLPMPVGDKGERNFFPTMLLIVDEASGLVLHYAMITPKPSLDAAYANIPSEVLEALIKLKINPKTIKISSVVLQDLFFDTFEKSHIKVEMVDYLENCSEALENMLKQFGLS